ncbi:MAG: hypothetical protein PWP27_2730 [Clostridiales bacterium]|nr:hypothetical protein [Clostridiales bacterium]
MAQVITEEIQHEKFGRLVKISNGIIEIYVPYNFGPRIMHYSFCGESNVFCDDAPAQIKVGEEMWKMMGGHRFWHSPEVFPRTYMPDNQPVTINFIEDGIIVIQETENWVQVQKELEIIIDKKTSCVKVVHKLTNKNAWDIKLALWGLTVMKKGGYEVIPYQNRDTGFLSNRHLALWPYTHIQDKRVNFGKKYIGLSQNPREKQPFKIGINNEAGWAAYFNQGNMFVKKFKHDVDCSYPDGGCSYETYTTDFMLEMESLSPISVVKANTCITHTEYWYLFKDIEIPKSEEEMDIIVKKYIEI